MATRNPNLDMLLTQPEPTSTVASSAWFTGLPPEHCPGLRDDGTLGSLMPPNLASCTRAEVMAYFNNTWTLTEVLFSALVSDKVFYQPPYHGLRHPMIFYYGHPAVLYVNKLRVAGLIDAPLNGYFESVFETGVDEMSWDDMSKNEMEWPSISAVADYRRQVYALVAKLIATHPGLAEGHSPILEENPLWALFMSFEHERIHIETSSVLMRELPLTCVRRPPQWPALRFHSTRPRGLQSAESFPKNRMISLPATRVRIGKSRQVPLYGWDNEYGQRELDVPQTRLSQFLVQRETPQLCWGTLKV